jgi:hypothetical protein
MVSFHEICKYFYSENSEKGRVSYLLLKDKDFSFRKGKSGMLRYLISHEKASAETLRGFMELYDIFEKKKIAVKELDTIYG